MDPVSSSVLEGLVGAVTEQVFAAVAPNVRAWLGREPAQLAFQTALLRAINCFAEAHSAWAAALLIAMSGAVSHDWYYRIWKPSRSGCWSGAS